MSIPHDTSHDAMGTSASSSSASDIEYTPPASDTGHTPPASDKKYSVHFHMASDPTFAQAFKWAVLVKLRVDLAFMEQGLLWTTENILLLGGYLTSSKSFEKFDWPHDKIRIWDLREFPHRPAAESRWSGTISLCADSERTLDGFRLGQLRRQLIFKAWVTDDADNLGFNFDSRDPAANKNELFDSKPSDLWWLWPMESIIPEEEDESSSHTQACDGKETSKPERRVTADRVSWPDVAILVCAAPAISALAVAWGIFVLLAAVSTALLEFGGNKGKGEPARHATVDRTSWQEELTGGFRRVAWPSWKGLVTGLVASVWGIGCFTLFADEVLHNRHGLVESFFKAAWPSWEELVRGAVVGTWGIGSFLLLANEVHHNRAGWYMKGGFTLLANMVLHNGSEFVEIFRWVGLPNGVHWWDFIWGTIFGIWGVGSFVVPVIMIARNGWKINPH